MATEDIIDTLATIEPGSALDVIRARRLQGRGCPGLRLAEAASAAQAGQAQA